MLLSGQSPLGNIGLTDVNTFLNTLCYDFETKQLKNDRPECEIPTLQFIHAYTDRGVVVAAPSLLRKGTDLNDNVVSQLVKGNAKYGYIVLGCPPRSAGRARVLECYARHMTHTTFHSVGTAALGRVLDARLRVRGDKL
ncbi:hypothetical protein ACJJTC_005806 [Scirpophaga incertulas]